MAKADHTTVVFDLGGVLIDWDPRHLYRKLFAGDDAAMEHFLATVCTHDWHRHHDAGRSFAEGCRLLKAEHPDQADLIDAFGARQEEMIAGPIDDVVTILRDLRNVGVSLSRSAIGRPRASPACVIGSSSWRGSRASWFPARSG